jgi:LacI family transcriptional regulator
MAVTRADVARRAGVSPAVVSYVLNPGLRPVADATRAKVEAAVAELGYRPNAIARALRSGPTKTIGLLVPDHTNPFFAELAQVVEDTVFDTGYVIMLGSTNEDTERESRYIRSLVDRQVDALVLIAPRAHPDIAQAVANGVPVVALDRVPQTAGVTTVRAHSLTGSREGVAHLIGLGHRRIGIIAGPQDVPVADRRLAGWAEALRAAGIEPEDTLVEHAPFTRDGGQQAMATLIARTGCTAVFASSDVQAIGALTHARGAGLRVPEDLSVVSFDGTELARHAAPRLTAVVQPLRRIAELAAAEVVRLIADPAAEPRSIEVPTSLELGDSTAPPRR